MRERPPLSTEIPQARCSEGHVYNPYKHASCPKCP